MTRRSSTLMIIERRSAPIITLSLAISKSLIETRSLFLRAASRAASLTRFSRSAPAKPGVWRARRSMFTSSPIGTRRVWTFRMPAAQACTAVAPDGVDLIDENDAWSILFTLHEQVPHPRGADADEHLDEVRAR